MKSLILLLFFLCLCACSPSTDKTLFTNEKRKTDSQVWEKVLLQIGVQGGLTLPELDDIAGDPVIAAINDDYITFLYKYRDGGDIINVFITITGGEVTGMASESDSELGIAR